MASWQFVTGALMFTLIAGLLIPAPRRFHGDDAPKVDIAKLRVAKYAYEAYPQWRAEHPTLECPRSLRALDGYMDSADRRDPWGRTYVFTCGGGKLYVMSLGEDGRSNTDDDVWSHQ